MWPHPIAFCVVLCVIAFMALDYVGFLREKKRQAAAITELESLGFGEIFPDANVHRCHQLCDDETQQRTAAAAGTDELDFTYGEMDLLSLAKLVFSLNECSALKLPPRPRLVDLGSGNGRMVVALAMMRPWSRCTGVELLPKLHASAIKALAAFERDVRPKLPEARRGVEVAVRCEDMLKADLSHEDVVIALSTAFSTTTMTKLFAHAERSMRPGAVLVVADQLAYPPRFACVMEIKYRAEQGARGDASWGTGTLGILVRRKGGTAGPMAITSSEYGGGSTSRRKKG